MMDNEAQLENVAGDCRHWTCMDCGMDAPETYMLTDALWRQANPFVVGVMCLRCVEDRLGRSLWRMDFTMPKDAESAREWPALAERFDRSNPSEVDKSAIETERFKDELPARLAKKRVTQSLLGRASAEFLLDGRSAELGEVPELIALLVRSGMFPADPLKSILAMVAGGHQRVAGQTLASLKARAGKKDT